MGSKYRRCVSMMPYRVCCYNMQRPLKNFNAITKINPAMVLCMLYENNSQSLCFYVLHSHNHFLALYLEYFSYILLLSEIKKKWFDIINHSRPTNEITYNNPLKPTPVANFNLKSTATSFPHRNSKSFHEL